MQVFSSCPIYRRAGWLQGGDLLKVPQLASSGAGWKAQALLSPFGVSNPRVGEEGSRRRDKSGRALASIYLGRLVEGRAPSLPHITGT